MTVVNCVYTTFFAPGGVDSYWNTVVSGSGEKWIFFSNPIPDSYPLLPALKESKRIYGLVWKNSLMTSLNLLKSIKENSITRVYFNGTLAEVFALPALIYLYWFSSVEVYCVFHNEKIYMKKWKDFANRRILCLLSFFHKENIFVSKGVAEYWGLSGEVRSLPVQIRPRCPKSKDCYTIAFVGRLSFEKGPDRFCSMAAELRKRNLNNFSFEIAGDGVMKEELEKSYEFIKFRGWLKDVSEFISRADLIVVSSRTEGFPIVPIEALRSGTPVLGFALPGVIEVVGPQRGQYLTKSFSVESLSSDVETFFAKYVESYQAYFELPEGRN